MVVLDDARALDAFGVEVGIDDDAARGLDTQPPQGAEAAFAGHDPDPGTGYPDALPAARAPASRPLRKRAKASATRARTSADDPSG